MDAGIERGWNMELKQLLEETRKYIIDPMKGLPEEIFQFVTEVTPMVNVDLLVRDEKGRILLSWRDDQFCGTGWHVPGGIIRLKESFEERIQKVALHELGCTVDFSGEPVEIRPLIYKEKKIRGHFITLVYECRISGEGRVKNEGRKPRQVGYLEWHDKFPETMIPFHSFYKKYFKE